MKKLYFFLFTILAAAFLINPDSASGQSFEIVDPGPQAPGVYFDLQLINARDDGGNLRNGDFNVQILTIEPQSPSTESLYSGVINFIDGVAFVPIEIPWSGLWYARVRIASHLDSQEYIYLSTDLSGFTIDSPGTQTAGNPFSINITAGKDENNLDLSGNRLVTIYTNNISEGSNGRVFYGDVSFSNGNATITDPGIMLTAAENQTLTVTVTGVTEPETTDVLVNPAPASKMVITTQPFNVTGTYDDSPVTLSTIVLETQDAFNNPSAVGFSSPQNVTASLSSNPGGATLGGTTTIDIQSGSASFSAITINQEGTGYTLNFTSDNPVLLTPVISEPFNVSSLYNLSEFTIASPPPSSDQYQDVDFQIQITGAINNVGENLSGTSNLIVTSSSEGIVFNNIVNFTNGAADFILALANLGPHTLTISVEGIDTDEIIDLTVNPDLSDFSLENPGSPQYADYPFSINISGATDRDGEPLSGDISVNILSSIDGAVFNQPATFTGGSGSVEVSLGTLGSHNLTVSIAGITGERYLNGISLLANETNFAIGGTSTSSQTAGINSVIYLIDATNLLGRLSGMHNVTVTSDITGEGNNGEVYNGAVSFTDGGANFNINLETAASHILTVSVEGITPVKVHTIGVSAAAASQLVITQQPAGGVGVYNDVAVNVGTITLQTVDQFGNFSILNLAGDQIITASISTDASAGNDAMLEGTLISSISSGTASFTNLTLNRDGINYSLSFSYTGSPAISAVISDAFDMTNVEDQSGFEIVPPGPQVINVPFNLRLINARDKQGNLFNILKRVVINRISPTSGVVFNSDVQFIDGEVSVPMTITSTGDFSFTVTVDFNLEESFTTVVTTDGSGFTMALNPTGSQTAGAPFDIDITNATDATATLLAGNRLVTVTSNNSSEGNNGILFNEYIAFTGGNATVSGLIFERAVSQILTVEIDWVKTPGVTPDIAVNPGPAAMFLITQQPAGSLEGSNNNTPVGLGTVILQIQDLWGNISIDGLVGAQTVEATITGSPAGVTLGGTTTEDIIDGIATFDNLTLDKNGEYTLSFSYNGTSPVFVPNPVISSAISITNLEDLSGFNVLPEPGTKYESIPFTLNISSARDTTGLLLNGPVNVTVTYGAATEIYNASTAFTDGAASFSISLPAGTHNLTVNVADITDNIILSNILVVADQSTFTLALDPGPYYINNPFNLLINGAKDRDNGLLNGNINVVITSNQPGEDAYNPTANFVDGNAVISLTMTIPATHILTVQVEGVTQSGNIEDVIVEDNISGFTIELESPGDKTAGSTFGLDITSATGMSGTFLTGDYIVTINSDVVSEAPISQTVTFTSGSASFNIDLKTAGAHTLSVSIESITPVKTVNVTVVAAAATRLGIIQQPAGNTGANDNVPVGIGTVIVQTQDEFGNLSVLGLSGTQQVSAAISTDASHSSVSAILGGTTTLNIVDGTATFNDLTINRDGIGYTLLFSYFTDAEPVVELTAVTSEAFSITDVNQYLISLKDGENPVANPLVFETAIFEYASIAARTITITREGSGIIQNLAVGLSGDNADSFTVTPPLSGTLDATSQVTTFTVKPNDGLAVGNYNAIVTVTADNGVAESFSVQFQVLATYAISLDAANPTVFADVYEGYSQIEDIIVTITNTGGNDITGLAIALAGSNPDDFVPGTITSNIIVPGATATFTIRPATGLATGTYSATVTVNNTEGVPQSFGVTFEVLANTYTVSLDPSGNIDFGLIPLGYLASPEQNITITRTGTGVIDNLTVAVSSTDFSAAQPGVTLLNAGTPSTSFTVQPVTGLAAGTYTGTVTVSANSMTNVTFDVTVRVVSEMVWTGSSSSNWHTPENWTPSVVPDQDAFIIIPSTFSPPVISDINVIVNNLEIQDGGELILPNTRRLTIRSGGRLTIQPGGKLTSTGTLVNNAGTGGLIVESNATATGSIIQSSSGVQASVQRYVTSGQWHIISSPVSGLSISGFLPGNIAYSNVNNNYALTHYDEKKETSNAGGWGAYYTTSTGGNLIAGKGYLAARSTDKSFINFTGNLNYETITIPVTRSGNGWNAIGNPFASAIGVRNGAGSSQNFLAVNSDKIDQSYGAIYIYDPDPVAPGYKIINNVPAEADQLEWDYVQSGQGFIVKSIEGGESISFTQAMRHHENGAVMKSLGSPWSKIKLRVDSENKSANTLIAFNSNMTRGLDPTYDAGQFGSDAGFSLYTRLVEMDNGVNFAIQALPDYDLQEMVIPLGFDFSEGGEVTFSAGEIQLPGGVSAILEDRQLGTFTDLQEKNYTVTLDANSSGPGRFFVYLDIRITNADDLPSNEKDLLEIYSFGKEIHIIGEVGINSYATLYDLMGRQIKIVKLENLNRNSFRVDEFERGIYLIRVEGEGTGSRKRIFIE